MSLKLTDCLIDKFIVGLMDGRMDGGMDALID
jgi:hypothetical protein